jgi:hypothetical protein
LRAAIDGDSVEATLSTAGVVMMGRQSGLQDRLFYEFCLEDRVPANHLLRKIDRVLKVDRLHE